VLYAGILLVRVLHGVLISLVRCDLDRNLLSDDLSNLVLVLPVDIAELLIECPQDVTQSIKFGFGDIPPTTGRNRTDFRVFIGKSNIY
jgi:hypothetical protein